jgi:predicted transcriptional regulator
MPTAKQAARETIDRLPDPAPRNADMVALNVKEKIEQGLADIDAGRTIPHERVTTELLGDAD